MKKKSSPKAKTASSEILPVSWAEDAFAEVVSLIPQARQHAYQSVNAELVGLANRGHFPD